MTTLFNALGIATPILSTLTELGYEKPTPIQAQSIPVLMRGGDLIAQAQTGTGKTAAFALPILSRLDITVREPQAIVIAPTRELAIQVAEAFQSYAKHQKGFQITPIYGGQSYQVQLRALKRGSHVIVGTPGRVMDHLRRGTLSTNAIKTLVLDEADEMLKMGFIDDVEWILEQIKQKHQTALFSATLPPSIQKIAHRYLKDAEKIQIQSKSSTVDAIDQCYIRVQNEHKLDVLTRYLEVEDTQASIIFTRTKNASTELAEKLRARGYTAAALNGDMNQSAREKVIGQIKRGALDIIVATDVAARGIDVERVTHVINFDIPCDTESYVHRIGRTGRAGRKGSALLLVTPREGRLLRDIERAIQKTIRQIDPPSVIEMKEKRSKQFADKILSAMDKIDQLGPYLDMIEHIIQQGNHDPKDIAAAMAYLMERSNPLPSREIQSAQAETAPRRQRSKPSGGFKKKSFGQSQSGPRRSFQSSKPEFRRKKDNKSGGQSKKR